MAGRQKCAVLLLAGLLAGGVADRSASGVDRLTEPAASGLTAPSPGEPEGASGLSRPFSSIAGGPWRAEGAPAAAPSIKAVRIVGGLASPVYVTSPPGDARLFVLEQNGLVRVVKNGALLAQPFLDVSGLIRTGGERGLLGIAFSPDFATSGLFYIHYTSLPVGDTVVARYSVSSNPDLADPGSGEVVLLVDQPNSNHNGGQIAFGPDGYLYFALGDGGGGGDPNDFAQNDDVLLGKMLRLDVGGGTGTTYTIPPDNPFAGGTSPLPEIWSKGFRNPYRWSFDRTTGDIYIGDVGQNAYEEVDVEPASDPGGRNYGWRLMEGANCFNPSVGCNDGSLTLPVFEYDRSGGRCAIIGGYVYRGALTELQGHYLFGDFCTREILSFVWDGGGGVTSLMNRTAELAPPVGFIDRLTGIGEDAAGELYLVDGSFTDGELYKIAKGEVPAMASLTSPSGATSTGYPTFTWGELANSPGLIDGATRYRLWVETTAGTKVIDQFHDAMSSCSASTCSVPTSQKLADGGYKWWVLGSNPFGDGAWSMAGTFSVAHDPAPPVAATLTSPSGIVTTAMPTYSWPPVGDSAGGDAATWYRLWVQGPSGKVVDQWYTAAGACGASSCSVTPSVALGEGGHRWWIQTWNPAGYGPWSSFLSFDVRTAMVKPGRAQTVAPSATIGTATPTFTWNEPATGGPASWYLLWVNGPSGPQQIVEWYPAASVCSAGSCSVVSPIALDDGDHTWWVRTWNSAGYGDWSLARNFTVATAASGERQ
jgi:glucose/arabinose dehydrogenase